MSAESFCEKELLIAFESREVHYCCVHRVHRLSNSPIEDDSRRAHRRVQLYLYSCTPILEYAVQVGRLRGGYTTEDHGEIFSAAWGAAPNRGKYLRRLQICRNFEEQGIFEFGRGVARAVYLLVSQSVSELWGDSRLPGLRGAN